MKRAIGTILILIALCSVIPGSASAAVDGCVTIWENGNQQGDHWTRCQTVTSLYNSTLVGDIAGLGGTPLCNTQYWPRVGNDWNDCVSGVNADLPSGYVLRYYANANYSAQIGCYYPGAGFWQLQGAANDTMTSWRVVTGVCGS